MKSIGLPGLDGSSLLGFLAGLGVLEAMCMTSPADGRQDIPRLSWTFSGCWHPSLTGVDSIDELVARVLLDARNEEVERVLRFRYVKVEKKGPKPFRALKAPVPVLRAAFRDALRARHFSAARMLAALACETACEQADDTKAATQQDLIAEGVAFDSEVPLGLVASPTPFDFTSRNTQFLDQLDLVRSHLTDPAVREDLIEGKGSAADRIMRWDARTDMPGALFGRTGPLPRPVAEWLAFRGTSYFLLSGMSNRLEMPGLSGRRKSGHFSWGLWDGFLNSEVIRSVVAVDWPRQDPAAVVGRGIVAGFSVELRKDATGYDGAVSASVPLTYGSEVAQP